MHDTLISAVRIVAALRDPVLLRDFTNVTYDASLHPRGPNGKFIGGAALDHAHHALTIRDAHLGTADARIGNFTGHQVTEHYGDTLSKLSHAAAKMSANTMGQLHVAYNQYSKMLQQKDLSQRSRDEIKSHMAAIRMVNQNYNETHATKITLTSALAKAPKDAAAIRSQMTERLATRTKNEAAAAKPAPSPYASKRRRTKA